MAPVTQCRVWTTHQARCTLCGWSADEIHADHSAAAADAYEHRRTEEHQARLATEQAARMAARRTRST